MNQPRIISLWSGPRNVSTAMMYSFAQREDTRVVDEPLYAYYLRKTGAIHPGREEVMASMDDDPLRIWQSMTTMGSSNLFIKNMAHHSIDLNEEWYRIPTPVLLIRDPEEMLPSLQVQIPSPTLRDTGLSRQVELFRIFKENGHEPVVIDSASFLSDLRPMIKKLCIRLSLPFDEKMLKWEAGPLKEDGIWAKYWYHRVHESRGFEPYRKKTAPFPERLKPLLDECKPYYNELLNYVLE